MSNPSEQHAARSALILLSSCTLREAPELKTTLVDCLEKAGDVDLDANGVARIDSSALQLLTAFVRDMNEAGRSVAWSGVSAEFARSARQLDLEATLGLPA